MPRISRFLFADWQKTIALEPFAQNGTDASCGATLRNADGTEHKRTIHLSDTRLLVEDQLRGFARSAVLRWRLCPGDWQIEARRVHCARYSLELDANVPIEDIRLVTGWESRLYLQKTQIPVVEIEIAKPGNLNTLIRLSK